MEKNVFVLALSVFVILAISVMISGCTTSKGDVQNETAKSCTLSAVSAQMQLLKGVSAGMTLVSGFQGIGDDISWSVDDRNVVDLNSSTGAWNKIIAKNPGVASITATDNSVGLDCKVSITITVTGPASSNDSTPGVNTTIPVANATECTTNESCFYNNLASCTPYVYDTDFETQGIQQFKVTIKGSQTDGCSVETLITTHNMPDFIGTSMVCVVPQSVTTKDSYVREFGPMGANLPTSCSGTYIDALNNAFAGMGS